MPLKVLLHYMKCFLHLLQRKHQLLLTNQHLPTKSSYMMLYMLAQNQEILGAKAELKV